MQVCVIFAASGLRTPVRQEARQIAYNLVIQEAFPNMEVWLGDTNLFAGQRADRDGRSH
jgi:hypothetical protein